MTVRLKRYGLTENDNLEYSTYCRRSENGACGFYMRRFSGWIPAINALSLERMCRPKNRKPESAPESAREEKTAICSCLFVYTIAGYKRNRIERRRETKMGEAFYREFREFIRKYRTREAREKALRTMKSEKILQFSRCCKKIHEAFYYARFAQEAAIREGQG